MIHKKLLTLLLFVAISFNVACESDENNQIALAETCINDNNGDPSGTASCASFLKGINTPRAKTLRCSITLSAGGLSNARIVNAIERVDDETAMGNEIEFMSLIALNDTTIADQIPTVCTGTDSPGIEFLANAARIGTTFSSFITDLVPGEIDENTIIESADLMEVFDGCSVDNACKTILGESAESMFDVFCAEADLADNEVCADVNSAIIASGDDPLDIGTALINLFNPTAP